MTVLLVNQRKKVCQSEEEEMPFSISLPGTLGLVLLPGHWISQSAVTLLQLLMWADGFCEQNYKFQKKHPIPASARALHEKSMSKLQSKWFLDIFWVDCVLLPVVYKLVWFIYCCKSLTSEYSCMNLQQESFRICLLWMLTKLFI